MKTNMDMVYASSHTYAVYKHT